RNAATSFKKVLGGPDERDLHVWMDKYKHTQQEELASFWNGLLDDIDAVRNAIKYTYTNGIVEGKNHRLKNKKRECYGRAGFELLRRKVILSKYG
ncbi:MAG: transposase, partial [Prevotella sp.]|nr:transposase [Prevotella sp.]